MMSPYSKVKKSQSQPYRQQTLSFLDLLFFVVIFASLIIRVVNLDYNSAFNDEAIYIVIGRMGLYTSDWLSYGAKLWMAGLPYIYPVLSALAYQTTGLLGTRFLNVIFGIVLVEEVYRLTLLFNLFDKKTNQVAALVAAFVSGFAATGIYVSKLATYDMLSFLLMMVGITSFLKARYYQNGKYYFISSISLLGAFLTKIVVAVFFPPLVVLSLLILKTRSKLHRQFAISYLYAPFFLGMAVYGIFNIQNFITYVVTHRNLGVVEDYTTILEIIWRMSSISLLLSLPASLMLALQNKIKQTSILLGLAAVIPLFHLLLHRYATLDKHMYLTVIFLSVVIGYGASLLIRGKLPKLGGHQDYRRLGAKIAITSPRLYAANQIRQLNNTYRSVRIGQKSRVPVVISSLLLVCLAIVYTRNSFQVVSELEHEWRNTSSLGSFLSQRVEPGDKVLTENGGAVILILYDKIFPPTNIVTFDWINYSGITDERAYLQAVKDEYFDIIELDGQSEGNDILRDGLRAEMSDKYSLIYTANNFEVYERKSS